MISMRERERVSREASNTSPSERAVKDAPLSEVDGELRQAVGYPWPVRITPRLAERLAPTAEEKARGVSLESRLRDVLWLAGIALSEMDPHDRVAPFEVMLDRVTTGLEAAFDTTDGLTIQITMAENSE